MQSSVDTTKGYQTNDLPEMQIALLEQAAPRFWGHVNKTEDCWLWLAYIDRYGYGRHYVPGLGNQLAHRLAYRFVVGSIPRDLELDHLCRNTACVNPSHLEPVTHTENIRRGLNVIPSINRSKTHCPQGHPYAKARLGLWKRGAQTYRRCNQCKAAAARRYRQQKGALSA